MHINVYAFFPASSYLPIRHVANLRGQVILADPKLRSLTQSDKIKITFEI
jgi:hypothetical protein